MMDADIKLVTGHDIQKFTGFLRKTQIVPR